MRRPIGSTLHKSGLFFYNGNRVILNKLPEGVKSYSIANRNGRILLEQPVYSRYKFLPKGNILVVYLVDDSYKMFQMTSNGCYEEVPASRFMNENNLEGEDVLLYHLGLIDAKYEKN